MTTDKSAVKSCIGLPVASRGKRTCGLGEEKGGRGKEGKERRERETGRNDGFNARSHEKTQLNATMSARLDRHISKMFTLDRLGMQ